MSYTSKESSQSDKFIATIFDFRLTSGLCGVLLKQAVCTSFDQKINFDLNVNIIKLNINKK